MYNDKDKEWRIVYFETPSGGLPVYDFIESLNLDTQSKVSNTLDLVSEYGIRLGAPHIKKVTGTDLWELRILGKDSIRIFYVTVTGKTFLLLHGFIKKSQKAPKKELKVALSRLKDYKTRNN